MLRFDGGRMRYEARTATGRVYDAFERRDDGNGVRRLVEQIEGRIEQRNCARAHLKGRADRCWE